MKGEYKVKNKNLKILFERAKQLSLQFDKITKLELKTIEN